MGIIKLDKRLFHVFGIFNVVNSIIEKQDSNQIITKYQLTDGLANVWRTEAVFRCCNSVVLRFRRMLIN